MHVHFDELAALAAWCGAPIRPVAPLLFLTGLVGGLAHCGPMCGPFVLAQTGSLPGGGPVVRRLAGGLLLPYHLGRMATYAALGAVAAGLGLGAVAVPPVRFGVAGLLITASLLFAAQAARRLIPATVIGGGEGWAGRVSIGWAATLGRFCRIGFGDASPARRFALGAVLGLLPCGFLYTALAAAAATQSPLSGAAAMVSFGLGTAPSLLLVGFGAGGLAARWRQRARQALPLVFLFNAAVLAGSAVVAAWPP